MAEITEINQKLIDAINEGKKVVEQTDRAYLGEREPFVITSELWLRQSTKQYIFLFNNPGSLEIQLSQRMAEQKTHSGTILHVWPSNDRESSYDEPVLTMEFQTGSTWLIIVPDPRDPKSQKRIMSAGLKNYYDFLGFLSQPKILDDGEENVHIIIMNTINFPQLTVWGQFQKDGPTYRETVDSAGKIDGWSVPFTVYHSYPPLHRADLMKKTYEDQFGSVAPIKYRSVGNTGSRIRKSGIQR